MTLKTIDRKKIGKQNRAKGLRFENSVRKDLESQGWIVDKWSNNVEFFEEENHIPDDDGILVTGRLIPARRKYNPFNKALSIGTGFPDFIIYTLGEDALEETFGLSCTHEDVFIIGVEVKSNGYLDKEEKLKCEWLLKNKVFSKILIASKDKSKKRVIVYKEFWDIKKK